MLMADQLRFDQLAAYGGTRNGTPNLDALAADSVALTMYSSTPTCTPARAALLTGRGPWGHGMLGYGNVAPAYPYEMPRALAAGGYATVSVGKDHFGWNASANSGNSHGYQTTQLYEGLGSGMPSDFEFDNYDQWFQKRMPGAHPMCPGVDWNSWRGIPYCYDDESLHPTAWVGTTATQLINSYPFNSPSASPLFLKVSWHRPHSPYDPPARLLNESIAKGPIRPAWINTNTSAPGAWDYVFWGQGPLAASGCGPRDSDAWCGIMPSNESDLARHAYLASVSFMDEWLGQVVAALKAQGVYDDAVIVFLSDHGDGQGDHAHWRKGFPHEFSARVPLLVKWPASDPSVTLKRGTVIDASSPQGGPVAEMRDIFPTMADYAGLPPPPPGVPALEGQSLRCILRDPTGRSCGWRSWLDLEHAIVFNASVHWSAATDGQIKYIFNALDGSEQLFNLTQDPTEMVDLARIPGHSDTLALWRTRLVTLYEQQGRGSDWVVNGQLIPRPQNLVFGPNFPIPGPPFVQARLYLEACQDDLSAPLNNSQLWQLDSHGALTLRVTPAGQPASGLCINATVLADASGGAIDVDACRPGDSAQGFTMTSRDNSPVIHTASGLCLGLTASATSSGTPVTLLPCDAKGSGGTQVWTLGFSGRLFPKADINQCVTALDPVWAGSFGKTGAPTSAPPL